MFVITKINKNINKKEIKIKIKIRLIALDRLIDLNFSDSDQSNSKILTDWFLKLESKIESNQIDF